MKHLNSFKENLKLSDFEESFFAKFVDYQIKSLRLQNSSVLKNIKLLKWFLKLADKVLDAVEDEDELKHDAIEIAKLAVFYWNINRLPKCF